MINFNILRVRYFSYFVSFLIIFLFVFGIFYKRMQRNTAFLYSIEFSGGYQVHCSLKNMTAVLGTEDLKKKLEIFPEYMHVNIRKFSDTDFLLKFAVQQKEKEFSQEAFQTELIQRLNTLFIDSSIETSIVDSSFVGPGVGNTMTKKAIYSILISLLLMFIYIWMRFPSWRFSFANILSLGHDVLVILLFLMWGNIEISLDSLIAILFIVGYSINDTIVIFAKIRDTMHKEKTMMATDSIINKSIMITFRRTILTSLFTAIVVFPLWLFGGASLEVLAAPILLGIIFGTYSSVAIACSILYDSFKYIKTV